METSIRKVGNSAGLILPVPLLKAVNLAVGQQVDVEESDGRLIVTPKVRTNFTLKELLAQCNPKARPPADMVAWQKMSSVGRESI